MRVRSDSSRYLRLLLPPLWPFLEPSQPGDAEQVRSVLLPFWTKRLARVPEVVLSGVNREQILRLEAAEGRGVRAGMEWVDRAGRFDVAAFWFFDLGGVAWSLLVRDAMRADVEAGGAAAQIVAEVATLWRDGGAEGAARALSRLETSGDAVASPSLLLARFVFLLWGGHRVVEARRALARAEGALSASQQEAWRPHLELAHALLIAAGGDAAGAAERLVNFREPGRLASDSPLALEVAYQAARYLWADDRDELAADLLEGVFRADPAFLLRFASDPFWGEHPVDAPEVYGRVAQAAEGDTVRLRQWVRTREEVYGQRDPFEEVVEVFGWASGDVYPVFAAVRRRAEIRGEGAVEAYRPPAWFSGAIERIRDFSRALPPGFGLRLGPNGRNSFAGGEGSEMAALEEFLADGEINEALVETVRKLLRLVPLACRAALFEYGRDLTDALVTAADLAPEGSRDVALFLEWADRCETTIPMLESISSEVDGVLLREVRQIFDVYQRVEDEWANLRSGRYGDFRIATPKEPVELRHDSPGTVRFRVTDWSGTPIPGVPFLWRVQEGPARGRETPQCLNFQRGITLRSGEGYLTVDIPADARPGTRGSFVISIRGAGSAIEIPYIVR